MHLKIETVAAEIFGEQMTAKGSRVADGIDKVKGPEFNSSSVNLYSSVVEMQVRIKKCRGEGGIDEIQVSCDGGFLHCTCHM